jgi:ATP-binding cassette, subfamily B, heavy metal transporter
VVIIFYVQYAQYLIGSIVFAGVCLYITLTVIITRWRRSLRAQTNQHDNDFHDKMTDSIINFETIKYFTAEDFELLRFRESVRKYQQSSTSTKLANTVLNIAQQVILNLTLASVMVVAAASVINGTMSIGEWIAMQAWVGSIFVPLNFLGGIYSGIVQAMIDIKNLSELLAEEPEVTDIENAMPIPRQAKVSTGNQLLASAIASSKRSDVSVEFNRVSFTYPGQESNRGLRNVSFRIDSGTTTAIVGSTGKAFRNRYCPCFEFCLANDVCYIHK